MREKTSMRQKTNQVHTGDHSNLSLTMQGHLRKAGVKHCTTLPKYDTSTVETVSVYLVHVYNEQQRRKNAVLS